MTDLTIDFGTIKQLSKPTVTFIWPLDSSHAPTDLTGFTVTCVTKNLDTGAVAAATGVFTVVTGATRDISWAMSAGDSGTAGIYGLTFEATDGTDTIYTLYGSLDIEDNPAVDAVQNPPLADTRKGAYAELFASLSGGESEFKSTPDLFAKYAILSAYTTSAELVEITNVSGDTYTATITNAHSAASSVVFLHGVYLTPEYFGASPDLADNSMALQALFDAIPVIAYPSLGQSWGIWFSPNIKYDFATTLTILYPVSIFWNNSELHYTGSSDAIVYQRSNTNYVHQISWYDFLLTGTSAATNGLVLFKQLRSSFYSMNISGFSKSGAAGLYLAGTTTSSFYTPSLIDNDINLFVDNDAAYGGTGVPSNRNTFHDLQSYGSTNANGAVQAPYRAGQSTANGNVFIGGNIENSTGPALMADSCAAWKISNVQTESNGDYDFEFRASGGAASQNHTIYYNTLAGASVAYIKIDSGSNGNSISNNTFGSTLDAWDDGGTSTRTHNNNNAWLSGVPAKDDLFQIRGISESTTKSNNLAGRATWTGYSTTVVFATPETNGNYRVFLTGEGNVGATVRSYTAYSRTATGFTIGSNVNSSNACEWMIIRNL